MKASIHIQPFVMQLVIAAITLVLFTSCKATQKNVNIPPEAENGNQSIEAAENSGAGEQKPEALQNEEINSAEAVEPKVPPDIAGEATGFELFESAGLKLLYPSEWSLTDRTENSKQIDKNIIAEYNICSQKDLESPRIGVRIAEDIPDGGIEKRKEEANLFFESSSNIDEIVFEDIIINGCDFYKISYPFFDDLHEVLLIAVKNNKRYDIWADYNKDSQEEAELIDNIFNSIDIID